MIDRKTIFLIVEWMVVIVLMLAGSAGALSSSGDGSWMYYRNVTINNTGSALSDYQVMVNLTGEDFPMNANSNGADIRFEQGGAELSYWIEDWDYVNKRAKAWVNVTSMPAGSTVIRMWYGNTLAHSSSNGDATFDFFDDASGIYTDKWTTIEGIGVYDVIGGKKSISLTYPTTNIRTLSYQMRGPVAIDAELYATELITAIQYYQDSSPYTNERYHARIDLRGGSQEAIIKDGSLIGSYQDIFSSANSWITTKLTVDKNGNHQWYVGGTLAAYVTDSTYSNGYLTLNHHNTGSGAVANLRVRKFVSPEPLTVGISEELDAKPRNIKFIPPTPANAAVTANTSVQINMSITNATDLSEFTWNWNGTNYTFYNDSLKSMMNFDNVSALGETLTKAVDVSKYGNNGTIYGAAWDSSGKYGSAMSFDGVNDYLQIADSPTLDINSDITIEAWIYPKLFGQYRIILSKWNPKSYWFGCHPSGFCGISITSDGVQDNGLLSTSSLSTNTWHHLVGTYDSSTGQMKVFVDGILDASKGTSGAIYSGTSDIWIGGNIGFPGQNFYGLIDEVRIYNRSLGAPVIKQLYYSNLNKYDSDKWKFYTNQSDLTDGKYAYYGYVKDVSGNGNQTETRQLTVVPSIIESCSIISLPGNYILTKNILNSANNTCIRITTSDVIFDGAGYTIDGIDASNTIGVYVNNPYSGLTNVTVKNAILTDWYTGIFYNNAPNGILANSIANSNLDWGIRISSSSGTNLTNNIANSNSQGIWFESSSNGLNDGGTANSNSNYGFYLTSSNGNVFNNNTINSNSYYGMYLDYNSNYNTLTNNTISLNGNNGLRIDSTGNNVYNNKFNNNNNYYSPYNRVNSLNTTKTYGENIIGGPYLGGNYWANPSGTGFSNICWNADNDGICDTSYIMTSNNIDPMPLTIVGQGTSQLVTDSCSIISLPGSYILNKSILNSANNTCIRITSNDVIFDGAGYTIDGIDVSNTIGVYVNNPYSGLRNVTVKNIIVTDWNTGIYYNNAPNGSVANSTSNSNLDVGIRISSSSDTNLTSNIANSNSQGIYFESSSNGLNDGDTANSNSNYGFRLTSSSGNVFNNSTVNSNFYGFYLGSSSNNVFNNNTINSNSYYGMYLDYNSNYNTLTNNTISLNGNNGLRIDSTGNNIYNNKFNNNNNYFSSYNRVNSFNTTKTYSENIIGGLYLGGNYWANPSGTGFSNVCGDADSDGICDISYIIASNNIDPMPLTIVGQGTSQSIIGSCSIISLPGSYILNNSILNSANNTCIRITSNDVIFDGTGYTIDGTDASNTIGVYVNNPYSGLTNVTVRNVTVTDWNTGIYYNNAPNGIVANSTASSNLDVGIRISSSSGTNLTNNIANSNSQGIWFESSSNGLNDGGTANSNSNYGFRLTSSNGNVFNNNTAKSNSNYGFQLSSSSNNVFNNNAINSNSYYGMYIDYNSNYNTLTNNTISLNGNNGLRIDSTGNNVYNNKFNNNNNYYSPYNRVNSLNTTKTYGENIIGGPYLGGNYWANPSGTGFSDVCGDADSDGICDTSYIIASNNIDPMPLTIVGQGTSQSVTDSCSIISLPGSYILNKSILNSGNNTCIRITSNDVIFDGAGYTIDGTDASNTIGIYVNNPYSGLTNVTVKNVTVTDWNTGIYYNNAPNGSMANSTSNSNLDVGIRISSSSGTNLTSNIANSNSQGIYFESSSNGLNDGDTANSNSNYGFRLTSSSGNVFNNSTVNSNFYGFYLGSSSNNVFNNNTINSNSYYGMYLDYNSDYNILTNNTISLNGNNGLRIDSTGNNVYNNKFNNNNNYYSPYNRVNSLNTTKTYGENIIGGPYFGGNYWANPSGIGFSETCIDADSDGFCDSSYNLASGNIDQLALKYIVSATDQPDLIISNVTLNPSNFIDGQTVTFNAVLENIGMGNTTRGFITRFLVDDVSLGDQYTFGLNSGSSEIVSQNWVAMPGEHKLKVFVDFINVITEANDTNNTFEMNLTRVEKSDLIVSDLTWTPSNFSDGNLITFNAIIENIGTGNTKRGFTTRFLIDGVNIGEKSTSGETLGTASVTQTWITTPGQHKVKVMADVSNSISESDENNNSLELNLTRIEPADLIVSDITWTPLSFADGQTVTFNAIIRNIGNGNTTRAFYTRFLVDDVSIGESYLSGLASGSYISTSQNWTATPGEHKIKAIVDVYYNIPESNDTNNTLEQKIVYFKNIALYKPAYASSSRPPYPPDNAFDGNIYSMWSSPTFPPAWIYVDLQENHNISQIKLFVSQYPDGSTSHKIYTSQDASNWTLVRTFSNYTSNNQVIVVDFAPVLSNVRYVKVETVSSPSWVGWLEIEVYEVQTARIEPSDMIISGLSWTPTSFSDGQIITFNATIQNKGPGNTTRGFYTRFLIDNVFIGEQYTSGLTSGSLANVSQTWTATPGEHKLEAIVDFYDHVSESNEINNSLVINLTKANPADLTVSNITWSPSNFSDGQTVTFSALVANIGSGNTTRAFSTRFFIDGTNIGEQSLSGLSSGSSSSVTKTWTATPGEHNVSAIVDIYSSVTESNESNNVLLLDLTKIDQPDLTVSSITWSPSNFSDGQTITFNAAVANIGSGNTTRGFSTRFFIDGTNIGEQSLSGLSSGSSSSITKTWTATSGEHKIKAMVDANNVVQEIDEANNALELNLTKIDAPDLIVSNLTWSPLNFSDNQVVTFNATITNIGQGDTNRIFWTKLFLDDVVIGEKSLMGLTSGASGSFILATWPASPGNHTIKAVVDVYNIVEESNKINNTLELALILPNITIYKPDSTSRWKGIQMINWTVDNGNMGPTSSTLYYWKPYPWAPSYLENSTEFFKIGSWVKLTESTESGNDSYLWDTTAFSGYSRIKIVATDGYYLTTRLSDVFIVNNEPVFLQIGNYQEPGGSYLTTRNPVIWGVVDATLNNIFKVSINHSDFNLTQNPALRPRGIFEFRSNSSYSGTFAVKITAQDEAGNIDDISAQFLVDPVGPQIQSAEFTNLYTENPVAVVVNATDNFGIAQVNLTMFGKTLTLNLSLDGLYRGSVAAPFAEGAYPAQIVVRDAAGNLNSSMYNLTILKGPDLEVNASGITFDPLTLVTGQHLNITARISNPGSAKVEFANVTFLANNRTIGSRKANLTASPDINFNWDTTGFAGNVTIEVRIEKSTNYSETNYSNNNASKKIFIDGPDLTVTNIAFNPTSPVFEGQVVAITATIVNLKPINANNVRISFYENTPNLSDRIDFKDVNVPASGSVNVSVNWQTAGLAGIQTVFAEANTNDLPAEVDRSNNILASQFETKKYFAEQIPDLLIFPQKQLPAVPGEKVRGMASNDFDQDNKTDFVVGTDKGKIILYKNNGFFYTNNNRTKNVNFTQVLIDDIGEAAWGMTSADLLGDGYPDLIVGTESGRIIFYNNSNGTFSNKKILLDVGDQAYGLAVSDFNNDNKFDIVVSNKKGQVNLYLNNMTGNVLTNESMVFNRTLTTRNQPFGLTTGDFDLDGHTDVMVGDGDGQIERIVWEIDRYNGFLFADVGSYAHGLTVADVDFSGKLDLFSTGFDGNVRMFFSREGGLVADPLIIGNVPESYGLTSGDYDQDNDIDVIVGSDNGNVTMLMNSLRIIKSSTPLPSPPKRNIEVQTYIQNPWNREMIELNLTEMWQDDLSFIKGAYPILLGCKDGVCNYFYADVYFFETPQNNLTERFDYYLQFPNTVCKIEWKLTPYGWIRIPKDGCSLFNYNGEAVLQQKSFNLSNVLGIFDGLNMLEFKEGFKYKYKFFPESVTNVTAITNLNYTLLGSLNTPNTDYLLSDDVTNLNNIMANTRNINPSMIKTDRDFTDNLIIAPDFTPINLIFTGYSYPPVPGKQVFAEVTIKNLNAIAINNVKVMFLTDDEPIKFCIAFSIDGNCLEYRNYTTFNIVASGTAKVSAPITLPEYAGDQASIAVRVNPFSDDIETNYNNNNISSSLVVLPPADLNNDRVYFSNGTVIKDVFTEGEKIIAFTNISNIGTNKSFSEDIYFLGFDTNYGDIGITPVNRVVNCTVGSPDYDANLCSGTIYLGMAPHTSPGNIEPGETINTNMSSILGDFYVRSQGVYNFTTIITNVGSQDDKHENDANFGQFIVMPSQEDLNFNQLPGSQPSEISLGNPYDNAIKFYYTEFNAGGYDIFNYDNVVYLDNNDSIILSRIRNGLLINHTWNNSQATIDWSLVPPGDHKVNFYLDYGKNASESTAKAVSSEGLIIKSGKSGFSGNSLSVSIQNIAADTFRLVITNKTEIVEQTAYDLQTRMETHTITYDQKSDHAAIKTVGDLIDVIQNGGYASDTFISSGLLGVETNGADLSAQPALQTLDLVIKGSLINERSDFNNHNSAIFRWKELVLKDIKFNPIFPSPRDIVTISSTIKNEGDIRTGAFNVTMYMNGLPVETKTISLLAHDTQIISFLYTIPQSDRNSYNVRIEADPENKIMKEDRSDNNITTSIAVSAPFELNVFSREYDINFLSAYSNNGNNNFSAYSFGLDNISMEYDTAPAIVDYEGDGDFDLITGSLDGRLVSYENIGTEIIPVLRETNWTNVDWKSADVPNVKIGTKYYNTVTISSLDVGARSAPEFVDLDNDSLMDLVIGDTHGRLRSFKSVIVLKNSVKKRAWVEYDFNLSKIDPVLKAVPRFADIDRDRDPDLIVGNQFGKLVGYENIGNAMNPDWQHKDFNLSSIDAGANAALATGDIDLDGDYDLVVGNRNEVSIYENTGNRTDPAWQKLAQSLSLPGRTEYRPALADLDGDGYPDLIYGSNNFSQMKLRKGYYEPVNVQIINYANNQIDIARIGLSVFDATSGNRITDLMLDGPFNHFVGYLSDNFLNGHRIGSQEVLEKEYALNIPEDLPDNTVLGVRTSKQENVNPAYFYELNANGVWVKGEKPDAVFINRPELGGNTFDLFVEPDTTYEYRGSYRVFFNGTMSRQYDCIQNWCAMYNLTAGHINTIAGSGEIRRLIHLSKTTYDIVEPKEPPIILEISNKTDLDLKTGYIEDIDLNVKNNNRRPYMIDRIALELYDNSGASLNGVATDETKTIDLFTDTSGFTLPPEQVTHKKYKVYVPDGVPTGAALLVKAIEKHSLADNEFYRSNIKDIWPQGSHIFYNDIAQANLYNNSNISLFTDLSPWGFQGFDYGLGCANCGAETSFLRKLVWIPGTLIKSEQRQYLHQYCEPPPIEPPSGITTWINGQLKSSLDSACAEIIYGWTPNFYELSTGKNNEFDLFTYGPHREFEMMFYEMVAQDNRPNATIKPDIEALDMNVTDIGNHGLLRRQYEEKVNITVTNNDDDPAKVDAVTMQLITPQNKKIQLMTDTKPRSVPPGSKLNLTYIVLIPGDVPLNSKLTVQVERVFEFPDKLWNRNRETTIPELLADGTMDYHWGDTLPTIESSKYRKRYFAPTNATRAEMILGDRTGKTDAYLNGEFQGSGYPGWSSMSLSSGLKQGQLNLLSISGAIPDTESRIYSGLVKTGGMVIEPEEEVYFAVFGVREQQYLQGREPFFVLPGEKVTARIQIENKYNKTLDYAMKLYVVDFKNQKEITLATQTLTVSPFEIKKLEVSLTIPDTVSTDTRLQLSSVWNEKLSDKNWLRGSNFKDEQASNNYLDDSQWGVVEAGAGNERAIYFRKHLWIDSTVQGIKVSKTGVAKMWVNGLEVAGDTLKNEFTKSESNLIALKATDYNIDADLTLEHFVPVRSTDIDSMNLNYSSMFILSQDNVTFENQSKYDCNNQTLGECLYKIEKGDIVKLNFTLRNAGELFARDFDLTVFARNVDTGKITEFNRETITMHPFSTDDWNVSWNTSKLTGGMYEFIVFPDANDDIIETSEYNNQIVRKIYVNAAPEVRYLYSDEIQGYNENVNIGAEIVDEDGNLANITLNLTQPDDTILMLNLSGSGDIYSTYFNNTKQGRYGLHLDAVDGYGKYANDSRDFDLFDSLYLNVKTGKDVYFYTQKVRLVPPQLSNLTKLAPNNKPVLAGAFDNAEKIKGGDSITINTNAFDPDGDLMTLFVCRDNQATGSGCTGGVKKTYCESKGLLNPACSFNTEKNDILQEWFAFVVDNKGAVADPIIGNYTTDSTPPVTKLYSLAGDRINPVDTQDDSKTIVTIQGEPGIYCKIGKDPINRFHKDRSYSFLEKECSVSNGFANCNLGNLKKDDPSKDRITNLTRAYVSCTDDLGNEQTNLQNLDIEFGIYPQDKVFDDYRGDILIQGSTVNISGSTSYCADSDGTCTPDKAIDNSSILFSQSGVQHLRYFDPENNIKETTIFINSRPNVSAQTFTDRLGGHAFDVSVRVSDVDGQSIFCKLDSLPSIQSMVVHNGIATATLTGSKGENVTTRVSCTDGIETVITPVSSHDFPDAAPMLRNIADISLEAGETVSIDMRYFGFDLENDKLAYSVVAQSDTGTAIASMASDILNVNGITQGTSNICLKGNDGIEDSNVQCVNVFVEDGSGSRLKNNEFTDTTIRLMMQIQHFDGNWQDEYSKETKLKVLPGPTNEIDLSKLFEWDTTNSTNKSGLFRVLFRAVDENNNTLISRDGKEIIDSYNFTLNLFNTPPNISGIPDQLVFENEPVPTINLLDYSSDSEQNIEDLEYAIVNQTNPDLVNCSITGKHLISCIPSMNMTGTSEINVSVFDGFAFDRATFVIKIIPYGDFTKGGNITYTFISDQFDVSGDPYSGSRYVLAGENVPPGHYEIKVIVSDGILNVSRNISVLVILPGTPVLEHIGNKVVKENESLSIWLNATDPDGKPLNYGIDANLPGAFSFSQTNGSFEWTPGFNDSGNYTVTFNVTNGNFTANETINISVLNTNRAPVLDLIPDITANESDLITISANVTDPDNENKVTNDDNNLTIFINDTIFTKNGSIFTWQTGFEDAGNFSELITVGDGELIDSQVINITILNVEPVEVPPKIINNSPVGSNVSIDAVINITFSKQMNQSSVEKAISISPQLNGIFNWTNNTVNFIPESLGYNITYNVTLTVDAMDILGNHMLEDYSWEFTTESEVKVNHAPAITPIENKMMIYSTILEVPINASDTDSDVITLSASGLPLFASFNDNGNGTGSIVFMPCSGINAIYPIIVSASDGSLSDSTGFNLTVKNVNIPPFAENQTVVTFENTELIINLTASDPDNDPMSFSIVNPPVKGTLSGTPPNLIYSPNPGYNGTDRLTFEAVDTQNEASIAIVNITVVSNASIANDNLPPIIGSITTYPANTTSGSTINISVKASDNTGVVKVTANGTIFKNSGGQWMGSITAPSVIGKASITINVIDAAGNTAQRAINYTVVNRVGGIAIASMPKPLTLLPCSSGILNVKLISTANIDDLVNVIINTNGISQASAINLTWFNSTFVPVQVPSGKTVIVPFRVTVPGDAAAGYRTFKDNAKSLGFNATSVDTGVVNVKK